jgi:hypothetical protein
MAYSIIQPPFTLKFREMSARELSGYRKWFFEVMPSRISELQNAINSSQESFGSWKPDYSVASINVLGIWFWHQVETRPRTPEEIAEIRGQTPFDFDVSENELTNRTFSLAMDCGMYLGETLRYHYPHLEWQQPRRSKRDVDYGQLVLSGFGRTVLNPVGNCVVFCYAASKGRRTGDSFSQMFERWSRYAEEASNIQMQNKSEEG